MTGVAVMPIVGTTWPQPCEPLGDSPVPSSDTCHSVRSGGGIEGVHGVVLSRHEHHVVSGAGDLQRPEIQGLRVNLAVGAEERTLAEAGGVDVAEGEHGLGEILTGAADVVLVGHDVRVYGGRRRGCRRAARPVWLARRALPDCSRCCRSRHLRRTRARRATSKKQTSEFVSWQQPDMRRPGMQTV